MYVIIMHYNLDLKNNDNVILFRKGSNLSYYVTLRMSTKDKKWNRVVLTKGDTLLSYIRDLRKSANYNSHATIWRNLTIGCP